ncbi:probable LRR receptor-like serine/threonine-protein kinase At1g05700 [Lolium perenne]|uniref:probable LRR receptor-like serine/threonine-protein kinase At1g05700 n=1 Tax=Lolium perenne TaxID=4522 RepID=UPI0021F514C7|nr:probable LRR receptor-like serine/threonine-protein kinase At1g05700 isoform X1 [Lolium perenne]XP_051195089.1 probable LRR receptor-like serine/threonine-protein kinase At1g05700 isoform X1 [Lolium perenne]
MNLCVAVPLFFIFQFIHAQPDDLGFISIDCGIPVYSTHQDPVTSILYVSDYGFIGTGENRNISSDYINPSLAKGYFNLRFFPHGPRNCYTLRSLVTGNRYLVRASFYYGNYDGLGKPPIFDLYLGANYWHEVNFDARSVNWMDIIVVSPTDYLQVCLVNKGRGTPFISALELRSLNTTLYPPVNASQSLALISSNRFLLGPTGKSIIRYPSDTHDRIWSTYDAVPNWTEISTTYDIQNNLSGVYDVPSSVIQNAATVNSSRMDFSWDPSDTSVDISSKYFFVFYLAELQNVPRNAVRQFDIIINNKTWNTQPYTPTYLFANYFSGIVDGMSNFRVSLVSTKNATLPPILNAMEMYLVKPITEVATDPGDAKAMMAIQEDFGVLKNWMGDPCTPKAFVWRGLKCSYSAADPSKITALNLSSFGLVGDISANLKDLKALQYLDLSHNNLSGPIPDFLGQLSLLIFLDLTSNDISGPIPDSLLQKSKNGSLSIRIGDNANLCGNSTACISGRKKFNGTRLVAIIVPIVASMALFIVLFLLMRPVLKGTTALFTVLFVLLRPVLKGKDESVLLENREFSYRELKHITDNFSQEIGKGGFGPVFLGYLENGNSVAVKVRSESSSQGSKEFLAEAQHLTRIHHKNLVSLIGYCKDINHLALVYEYMPEGDLQSYLRATSTSRPLTWEQRLQIALDAAQGLEYLHIACKPQLIHRDVKSRNILLATDLVAKIADFGLTKVFGDSKTHITTEPVGTFGYLDPEYFRSFRVTEKSDVFSFGVVLLELITGSLPVVPISDNMRIHIGEWVQQSLDHGTMENIVDTKMGGDYDINSVRKAVALALHCKREVSRERPAMAEVVMQLKECLVLENRWDRMRRNLGSNGDGLTLTCAREGSALEAEEEQGEEIEAVAYGPAM